MLIRSFLIAACCFGLSAAAFGATLSASDKQFLSAAAKANMTEAHEGQMAAQQASRSDVKDLANMMVQDHTQAYGELQELAAKVGYTIPTGINAAKEPDIVRLVHLKGNSFDRQFCSEQVAAHQGAIALFKREAAHGENADVKAYASRMVATLQKHLQAAQACAKPMKKS